MSCLSTSACNSSLIGVEVVVVAGVVATVVVVVVDVGVDIGLAVGLARELQFDVSVVFNV